MDCYSSEDGLIVEVKGPVLILTNDRPEIKNGGNWQSIRRSVAAWNLAATDPDIRVVVVTGKGEYFNTGGRVNADDPDERRKYAEAIRQLTEVKRRVRLPVIAAVNGHCLKGGMGVVAEADLAVAKRTAQFGYPEVRMGGVPMVVMAQTMDIPKKLLLEACYSCNCFDAETAYRIGLVNAVTDEDDFWPTVETYIRMVVDHPRDLIQMTHDAYYAMAEMPLRADRTAFAQKMLAEQVLPQMSREKTAYNV